MKAFQLALIQLDTGKDICANKKETECFVKEAALKGADLIILPEHSDLIGIRENLYAQTISGENAGFYAALAQKYHVYLHCGSISEIADEEHAYNTSLVFSPEGEVIGKYSKLHLFDVEVKAGPSMRESAHVKEGESISLVKLPFCTLGLSVCYDLRFPELYRLLALSGAEILVVSANFTAATGAAHWEALLRARAIENGCFVAAVNQCGQKKAFQAWGHTMLIDPWGNIMGSLEQTPGLLMLGICPDDLESARKQIPSLKNRRCDIYKLESDKIQIFE